MAFKNYGSKKKDELNYKVIEKLGVLDPDAKMPKELRVVSWNDGDLKYDLRSWRQNEDGTETPCKGITFSCEEIQGLFDILTRINNESEEDNEDNDVEVESECG